jgi:hypothetical protein
MKERVDLDIGSLLIIFNKNKSYIFAIIGILISLFLFYQLVIPQFSVLSQAQEETRQLSLEIDELKKDIKTLSDIDEARLESQLNTLKIALPVKKDYIGMLNTIYSIAKKTGINVGNFSIAIGDVNNPDKSAPGVFPMVKVSVPIDANIEEAYEFVDSIGKTATPLSDVFAVNVADRASIIGLAFYYMPSSVSSPGQDEQIVPISKSGLDLIDKLIESQKDSSLSASLAPVKKASSSASK